MSWEVISTQITEKVADWEQLKYNPVEDKLCHKSGNYAYLSLSEGCWGKII